MENVDDVMDEIREQMDLANEVSNAISQPVGFGMELDEVTIFYPREIYKLIPCYSLLG